MRKITKILPILFCMIYWSCIHKHPTPVDCKNEKVFYSLDTYIKTQNRDKNDPPLYPNNRILPSIDFDSFTNLKQVDSLSALICNQNLANFGAIPLKYCFNKDTVFLSAFPFTCNGSYPDIFAHIIFVVVNDTAVYFEISNYKVEIKERRLEDSLISDFTKVFKPFMERQNEITEKVKDSLEAKKIANSMWYGSRIVFNIDLQGKIQIIKLKTSLDIILTTYISTLRNCCKVYYKKDLFELSPFELKLFSENLFLLFEIH